METSQNPLHKHAFVWMDLEMTGLDPEIESIIEIATIITDTQLKIIEEGPDLVIHQPAKLLNDMDDWNQKQHKKSGLLEEVKKSKISLRQAEKQTLDFIKKHCAHKQSYLCGNSVHHDRLFLRKYMPKIHEYLHYRHIDVSTIKGLVQRWYPKDKKQPKKGDEHRSLADIRNSIEELKYYRKKYFK